MTYQEPESRLKALTDTGTRIQMIYGLDIQQYFRNMRGMMNMVNVYLNGGQKENAYKMLVKIVTLYLQYLPKHREYNSISKTERKEWSLKCASLLSQAESLKQELHAKYTLEYDEYIQAEKNKKEDEERQTRLAREAEAERRSMEAKAYIESQLLARKSETRPSSSAMDNGNSLIIDDRNETNLPVPNIDRSLKPAVAGKSNPYGWTTVRLSFKVIDRFLQLAQKNTVANRETCATLCGRLVGAEFHITDLILPKQSGTHDSVVTHKEEEMFEYTEKHCLMPLGWIHTHPTQTAFLSSVDQHCQLSYQLMLPEAVAIVCAPKFDDTQIFSLTPNDGIPIVRECRKIGFHPHPSGATLFEPSKHVIQDDSLTFNAIDLR